MEDDVVGVPLEVVTETLKEGLRAQDDLTRVLVRVEASLSSGNGPSDDSLAELEKIKTELENVNSCFEMTRSFLRERGLTNVRELDAQGKAELSEHLQLVLKAVKAENTPI